MGPRSAPEAATDTREITSTLTDITGDGQVMGSEAGRVLASVCDLSEECANLRAEVGRFLASGRAA